MLLLPRMLHAHGLLSTTGGTENTPEGLTYLYPILTFLEAKIYQVTVLDDVLKLPLMHF